MFSDSGQTEKNFASGHTLRYFFKSAANVKISAVGNKNKEHVMFKSSGKLISNQSENQNQNQKSVMEQCSAQQYLQRT